MADLLMEAEEGQIIYYYSRAKTLLLIKTSTRKFCRIKFNFLSIFSKKNYSTAHAIIHLTMFHFNKYLNIVTIFSTEFDDILRIHFYINKMRPKYIITFKQNFPGVLKFKNKEIIKIYFWIHVIISTIVIHT